MIKVLEKQKLLKSDDLDEMLLVDDIKETTFQISLPLVGSELVLYCWIVVKQILLDVYRGKYPVITADMRLWLEALLNNTITITEFHSNICAAQSSIPTWNSLATAIRQQLTHLDFLSRRFEITNYLITDVLKTRKLYETHCTTRARDVSVQKQLFYVGLCVVTVLSCCLVLPCICCFPTRFEVLETRADIAVSYLLAATTEMEKFLQTWHKEFALDSDQVQQIHVLLKSALSEDVTKLIVLYLTDQSK